MAHTVRRKRYADPRAYHPTKRARKIEKRSERQTVRHALRKEALTC